MEVGRVAGMDVLENENLETFRASFACFQFIDKILMMIGHIIGMALDCRPSGEHIELFIYRFRLSGIVQDAPGFTCAVQINKYTIFTSLMSSPFVNVDYNRPAYSKHLSFTCFRIEQRTVEWQSTDVNL